MTFVIDMFFLKAESPFFTQLLFLDSLCMLLDEPDLAKRVL
jgi:hypothetical protein